MIGKIRYLILSIFYRKLITTEQLKQIIASYTESLNNVISKTIDDIDTNKDGYISTAELVYLLSEFNAKVCNVIKKG